MRPVCRKLRGGAYTSMTARLSSDGVLADNDKSYTQVFDTLDKDLKVNDNGDGTLTILVLAASAERWYGPDGNCCSATPDRSATRWSSTTAAPPTTQRRRSHRRVRPGQGQHQPQRHRGTRLLHRRPHVHRLTRSTAWRARRWDVPAPRVASEPAASIAVEGELNIEDSPTGVNSDVPVHRGAYLDHDGHNDEDTTCASTCFHCC